MGVGVEVKLEVKVEVGAEAWAERIEKIAKVKARQAMWQGRSTPPQAGRTTCSAQPVAGCRPGSAGNRFPQRAKPPKGWEWDRRSI